MSIKQRAMTPGGAANEAVASAGVGEGDRAGAPAGFGLTALPHDLYRRMAELSLDGIWVVDADYCTNYVNPRLAQLLGYAPADMVGRSVGDFLDPAERDRFTLREQERRAGVTSQYDACYRRKDGTAVWVIVSATPMMDQHGQFSGAIAVLTDITERRRTERALARRALEQTTLYRFTDCLQRSSTLEEIYDAALDTIIGALDCPRASILLMDDRSVMRFVAWKGLSDEYRAAVEGHSPWAPDEQEAEPVCIEDVASAELPEELKRVVVAEGIGALAFIPLTAGRRLIGKFMVYYRGPHTFADGEMDLAVTVARQLTFRVQRLQAEENRQRAEEALRESEQRLHTIFQQSTAGIVQVDLAGRIVLANPRFCEIVGYSLEELKQRTRADITHPEDRERDCALFEKGLQTADPYTIEKRYVRGDGSTVWVANSVSAITDSQGRPVSMLAVCLDITERRRLQADQSRLAAIVASSEDAIVSKDLNGIVTSWNASAERIYGWKAEDIIGRSKALVIPPDLPNELESILSKIRRGERIEHYETRRIRKDGTLFDAAISVSPVKDNSGVIIGAATIVRDITGRKRTDRDLKLRTAEVEALNERLQRSMLETHHRVRNNLQMIAAFVDMQAADESDVVPTAELKRISSQVQALATVHELLTGQAGESGEATDLSSRELLERLAASVSASVPGRRIVTELEDTRISVKQGTSLAIIANELITNAVKYSRGVVEVHFTVDGDRPVLQVLDDGSGFPAGFDPNRQQSHGLALVDNVARWDLQGAVSFANRPTGGGDVTVSFPLIAQVA